eukprot:GHVS01037359.1.p1 GENE.GHVS01037359.1~~GHVS01037359.1.p1  ORF type:complete len:388 (+),score=50.21 GHVS01037359.1:3-1166(+)
MSAPPLTSTEQQQQQTLQNWSSTADGTNSPRPAMLSNSSIEEHDNVFVHPAPTHPSSSLLQTNAVVGTNNNNNSLSTVDYVCELIKVLPEASSMSIRATQARLTMFEILEHIDFVNDLMFIARVAFAICVGKVGIEQNLGYFALWWLVTIWLTSFLGYCLRPCLIYHRISGEHMRIFWPIIVLHQIKVSGEKCPQVLYMYERLYWTYALIMRVVEDIPQVVASTIFLLNYGRDAYAIVVICFSVLLLVITSIRMGMSYPLAGTVSLLLSTQPPVDSPVVSEATHTTYHITLYMAVTMLFWTATHVVTLQFIAMPYQLGVMFMCVASAVACVGFLGLWFYYSQQSEIDVDQRFMRGTSQTYPRCETMGGMPEEVLQDTFFFPPPSTNA